MMPRPITLSAAPRRFAAALCLLVVPLTALAQQSPPAPAAHGAKHAKPSAASNSPASANTDKSRIVAVVNGDVITAADVNDRRRLFALSTGLPVSQDVLDRLTPQVVRQLVDERLRLQEVQRRKIIIKDKEIADSIGDIEKQNHMQPGGLRKQLASDGVSILTLIDQLRVQLGWTRVLRDQLGTEAQITPAEVDEQLRLVKAQTGKPEYNVAEIFVPVEDPAREDEARRFANTVIEQLRKGAPFPVVAAQFSQSQTALQGGDLGWVEPNQVDPEVAHVIAQMPVGAVSNPIRVAGGYSIVTLRAKRQIGNDPATMLHLREISLPFTTPLDPANPTDQQRQQLEQAKKIIASVHDCTQMAHVAQTLTGGNAPPLPEAQVRLENVNPPQFRSMLASLPDNKPSQPLVSRDGIAVVVICSREQRNLGLPSKQEIVQKLLSDRIELASRQLQENLHRRATIDIRSGV
jgi:peptidyl-prolyl cis-trans isomerase SurA